MFNVLTGDHDFSPAKLMPFPGSADVSCQRGIRGWLQPGFFENTSARTTKERVRIMRRLPAPEEGKLGEAGQKLEELKGALDKPDTQQR